MHRTELSECHENVENHVTSEFLFFSLPSFHLFFQSARFPFKEKCPTIAVTFFLQTTDLTTLIGPLLDTTKTTKF